MSNWQLPHPLGPFLLLRHLASGGMGDVYLAHQSLGDVGGERLCVVKTVRSELGRSDDTLLLRFMDEARTTAFITHKNVASVIDVGKADGTAYLAVEHVAGRDLQAVVKKAKRLGVRIPEEVALYVVGELLDALAYVHQAKHPRSLEHLKIVHRDISPHNVMTSFAGEVKLIDFGIARSSVKRELTQAGQAIGKVRYMSPEQARAEVVDAATDVWAASIVATELLSGRTFWGDKPLEAILMSVAMGEKPRPPGLLELPKPLRHALKAGLQIDRAKRPSAAELKELILGASTVRPSSEALRALLRELFEGEEDQERQAHAMLLQEPTSVRAAGLLSHTANEDAIDDDIGAAPSDAPTASRMAGGTKIARPVDDDDDEDARDTKSERDTNDDDAYDDDDYDDDSNDAVETVAQPLRKKPTGPTPFISPPMAVMKPSPTRTTSAIAFQTKSGKISMSPVAAAAGAVLATCAVTAIAIAIIRSVESNPTPLDGSPSVVVERPAPPDPPSYDPPPEDRSKITPPPTIIDLTQQPPPQQQQPSSSPVAPLVATPTVTPTAAPSTGPAGGEPTRSTGRPVKARPKEGGGGREGREGAREPAAARNSSGTFAEKVRALRACKPAPTCSQPVLRRANDVSSLSPDELKALGEDVVWCLQQCK